MELLIVILWAVYHAALLIYFELRLNKEQNEMLLARQRRLAYLKSLGFETRGPKKQVEEDYVFLA
jgi:hypothetical protein